MNCVLCSNKASGKLKSGNKDYSYCDKHKMDLMIADDTDDPKAIDKLIKKYKGKKK